MMEKLREAVEWWDGLNFQGINPHWYPIVAAARRVLDAPKVEWCDFHKAAGDPGLDCWGAGLNGQDDCRMVPARLITEETE